MAKYCFLVRETLTRDRIYEIDADSEIKARDLLDGFKQNSVERPASQENIRVDDYYIKECYRSAPQIGDPIKYKGEPGSLSSIRGNWIINTLNYTLPIRTVELEWDEDGAYWTVLGDET